MDGIKGLSQPFSKLKEVTEFGLGLGVGFREFSIAHDKRPVEFKYNCQALRQVDIDFNKDIDNVIVYFFLEVDNSHEESVHTKESPARMDNVDNSHNIVWNSPQRWTDLAQRGLPLKLQKNAKEVSLEISFS
jgi:hypothetical protein